ncbi:Phosphocarrier protein HPr [Roseimaritima multifibrata]|uniref:Phosphocarrier protein HPr n=1 Tax=Roseimaritima multifibrata TaxID=1930274 RepID=A0A517MIQ9_9BACT|nr:HPr family phosphocarrier protein [Roseimaritima multifibrata]QDS94776.1 Phosphocarrier protein HPr [Roseimaritima multifibrata]
MSNPPLCFDVTVRNPKGLHLRAINTLVQAAGQFEATILIRKDSEQADCASVFSLMTLGAEQGTELTVTVEGVDAPLAAAAIQRLFENGFYEMEEA